MIRITAKKIKSSYCKRNFLVLICTIPFLTLFNRNLLKINWNQCKFITLIIVIDLEPLKFVKLMMEGKVTSCEI